MARKPARILLATASTSVGLLLCYSIWEHRPVSASAVFVDNRSQVEALIEGHLAVDGPSVGADPGQVDAVLRAADLGLELPPLQRREMKLKEAKVLFAAVQNQGMRFDRDAYYWCKPNLVYSRRFPEHPDGGWRIKSNVKGFRKSVEVREDQPDLRILFAGDSHTGGVVPEHENMVQVLEKLIAQSLPDESVEALNGGHGGYDYYQYLGTLERNIGLKPDVFVVVGFGGNDFRGSVRLYRFHNSLRPFKIDNKLPTNSRKRVQEIRRDILAQDLMQLLEFAESKQRMRLAELASCQVMAEIKQQCDEAGIRLIYVHIPPSMDVQPQVLGEFREPILEICQLTEEQLTRTDQVTDKLLEFLEVIGVETLDMRPTYAASEEDCYWRSDFHINTRGHRLIAEALLKRLLRN